jgi:response regulator RpfG family c-di-GMP phosphodiesterase
VDPLAEVAVCASAYPSLEKFLYYLKESHLVGARELQMLLADYPGLTEADTPLLVEALQAYNLINDFQAKRLLAGQTFGLVMGNYRVLELIGTGGMGVVYKAEHIHMKRPVALKVLMTEDEGNAFFLQRFNTEMQALAVLRHPNIVLAFDAGALPVPGQASKVLRYLVMEYVQGQDLEQYVLANGPAPIHMACEWARQAASGLRHAHEHGMVHRDIKPSNLLVMGMSDGADPDATQLGQLKILDFGLARMCRRRCTAAHSMLGTVDFMAPEQARDARSVDIRADIYGLGGTLYWLLTGARPFPGDRAPVEEMLARQHETPAPPRSLRPDIPLDLEAIVCQMMARDPSDRYPTPLALIAALNDFMGPSSQVVSPSRALTSSWSDGAVNLVSTPTAALKPTRPRSALAPPRCRRALVVSPQPDRLVDLQALLEHLGLACTTVSRDDEVGPILQSNPADMVLIDGRLDQGPGLDLCRRLRAESPVAHLKLLLLLTQPSSWEVVADPEGLCDDQVPWPISGDILYSRIRMALRLKEAEDRADRMANHLVATNTHFEQALQERDATILQSQDLLIFAMAKLAELRGQETEGHLRRMQGYVRVLSEEVLQMGSFSGSIDDTFVCTLERCVLLHDIGKVAIPDHILLKPGKLDAEERSIMESHTVLGANLLESVMRQHGASLPILNMAIDIVRYHHEHYDGNGYPDGLVGDAIPLCARIVAIADAYDAMRSRLVYKPGLSHTAVRRLMLVPDQGQFDPALLLAFRRCDSSFEQVFEQWKN